MRAGHAAEGGGLVRPACDCGRVRCTAHELRRFSPLPRPPHPHTHKLVHTHTWRHAPTGYSQTASMMALLEAGADPLLRDAKGQDVPLLIDGLRQRMPPVAAVLQRRMALEQARCA